MAAHLRDDLLHGRDHSDTHASDTRWRHEESGSFARHAARAADERTGSSELAGFLNASRVKPPGSAGSGSARATPIIIPGNIHGSSISPQTLSAQQDGAAPSNKVNSESLHVKCGPLLNYRRMENGIWFGSVLIVMRGGGQGESTIVPELHLRIIGAVQPNVSTSSEADLHSREEPAVGLSSSNSTQNNIAAITGDNSKTAQIRGTKLYSDRANTFWRFDLEVPMQDSGLECQYTIPGLSFEGKKTDKQNFFVPAITESMKIMFHSCNGFSVGTDEDAWSGPALWNDVLRVHKKTPFHVMIGGGDQIYNDGVRVGGPLRKWTDIGNPLKRKEYPFPEDLRRECDEYYVDNYIRWYGTEPFASANGKIAQLNIWDSPQTTGDNHVGIDPRQLENTFVLEEKKIDPSYIIGSKPGPYVAEHSRSIYARLGKNISFLGIDARTERTRKQVNYPETYEIIFNRLRRELNSAKESSSPISHLIVLLGIPIAYPRLTWLENIFSSPAIAPIKFLNKRFGFGGGFFNHFDGSVDLLDDLDDHWTARNHKRERLFIVQQFQEIAAEFSVRITILGGDVHLAAVGRFYSNPKLNIQVQNDHRYMVNVISSAIVNKPPPQAVANLLALRNKLHHLDQNTDETLLKFFDKDPGIAHKTASSNHVTMPSRNWAMITENSARPNHLHHSDSTNNHAADTRPTEITSAWKKAKDGHSWLDAGEVDAGTTHKAANMEKHGKGTDGSLDLCIRVEMDQHDKEGRTQLYGMTIPLLDYQGAAEHTLRKRDAVHGAINERIAKYPATAAFVSTSLENLSDKAASKSRDNEWPVGESQMETSILHQQLPNEFRPLQPQNAHNGQPHLAHHALDLGLEDNEAVFHQDLRLQDPNAHNFQTPNPFDRNHGHRPMHIQNNGSPHTPQQQHGSGGQFGILTTGSLHHNSIGRVQAEEDMFGEPEGSDQKSNGHLSTKIVVDPPDLQIWRQRLFDVSDLITLSEEEFQTYFPHVDNVYSHRSTQRYKRKPFVSHYWDCRLKGRPPGTPKSNDPNKKKRKRTARERDLCDVKIKITEYFPGAMLRADFVPDGGQVQADGSQNNNFFAPGQPGGPSLHQQPAFGIPMVNNSLGANHPGASGQRYYTIQRVNGNGGNGKGDGVPGPHKHPLSESDRVKKNSVQRYCMKRDKEEKKTQKTYHKRASGNALATVRKHSKEHELKLFGSCFCPFVQRVWIAMELKGLAYQYIEVDPYKKPQALLEVNPRGLVPGIRHGDWGCGESTVLMEYLEDLGAGQPLLPQGNPQFRANCRLWSDHINRRIVPAFYQLLQAQDFPKQAENTKKLQDEIKKIVDAADMNGPFFLGQQISFVDVQLAPWMLRFSRVLKHYRGWPDPAPGSRWALWMEAVENNEHVRNTTSSDDLYIDSYERYAQNRPNTSELADAINGGLGLP